MRRIAGAFHAVIARCGPGARGAAFVAFAAGGWLLTPNVSPAQLTLNRMELVVHASVPAERQAVIGVRNETPATVQAVVRLEDWDRASDGTNRWYRYGSRAGSCGSILSVFPLALRLDPGATQSIRLTMDGTAPPSEECWAAAVVETMQPANRASQGVAYVLRTAVKIYVEPPAPHASGEITALRLIDAPAPTRGTCAPAPQLEFEFANSGTRHLATTGGIEFRRQDNSVAAQAAVPNVYALPGARQVGRATVPRLAKGHYVALLTLDYGGDEIAAAQLEYEVARTDGGCAG